MKIINLKEILIKCSDKYFGWAEHSYNFHFHCICSAYKVNKQTVLFRKPRLLRDQNQITFCRNLNGVSNEFTVDIYFSIKHYIGLKLGFYYVHNVHVDLRTITSI